MTPPINPNPARVEHVEGQKLWSVERVEGNANYQRHYALKQGSKVISHFYFTKSPVDNEASIRWQAEAIRDAHNASLYEPEQQKKPRVEQCVKCREWTSDWVDPDGAGGRICRYCDFLSGKPDAVAESVEVADWANRLADCLQLLVVSCMDQKSWNEANALLRLYYANQEAAAAEAFQRRLGNEP